jgi:5-methyltetrahydrofolate--homocysteine methyltransferase
MFQLLPGQEIGVTLTDGFQLSPDASTAAFIVHHPEAKYFSAYKHGKTGAASDAAG